jgi:hypothetical protein
MKLRVLGALCAALLMLTAGDCNDKGGAKDSAFRQMSAAKKSKLDALPKVVLKDLTPQQQEDVKEAVKEMFTENFNHSAFANAMCLDASIHSKGNCSENLSKCQKQIKKHDAEIKDEMNKRFDKFMKLALASNIMPSEIEMFFKMLDRNIVLINTEAKCGMSAQEAEAFGEKIRAAIKAEAGDSMDSLEKMGPLMGEVMEEGGEPKENVPHN